MIAGTHRVVLIVLPRELLPDECERLAVKHTCGSVRAAHSATPHVVILAAVPCRNIEFVQAQLGRQYAVQTVEVINYRAQQQHNSKILAV